MAQTARHDAWTAGDHYDAYMGRWSRIVAPAFLYWLGADVGLDWLDVGCCTGALTARIVADCEPRSVSSIDPSAPFLDKARSSVSDSRVKFRTGSAESLDLPADSRDVAVSALVLNSCPAGRRRWPRRGG